MRNDRLVRKLFQSCILAKNGLVIAQYGYEKVKSDHAERSSHGYLMKQLPYKLEIGYASPKLTKTRSS
jgi:hypothetical protein